MEPLSVIGFTWSAVHAILAACTLFGGSAFWVLWHLHNRLRTLEEGGDERNEAIFGTNDNPLHVGLAREVRELQREINSLDDDVSNATAERREIQQQLDQTERKLDRLLSRKDE